MSATRGFRPRLEALEQRWVPATIRVVGGVLLVSDQTGPLTITPSANAAGVVTVSDGGKGGVTVSGVGRLIAITGTSRADSITFNGGTGGFKGDVLIRSGNGDDTVTVSGGT